MARASNKDRIARLAAEKAAGAAEKKVKAAAKKAAKKTTKKKAAKKTTRKKTTRKSAAKVVQRMQLIWLVCDRSAKEVRRYPFNGQAEARAEAERLAESSGQAHFVRKEKIPFEPEPAPEEAPAAE